MPSGLVACDVEVLPPSSQERPQAGDAFGEPPPPHASAKARQDSWRAKEILRAARITISTRSAFAVDTSIVSRVFESRLPRERAASREAVTGGSWKKAAAAACGHFLGSLSGRILLPEFMIGLGPEVDQVAGIHQGTCFGGEGCARL